MNELNREMFEHKFTDDLEFRSSFEKIKCFRVMDEEGNISAENQKYEKIMDVDTMKKIFH